MGKMSLYRLTDGDRALFERSKANPNWFTDWYIRSDLSGTWWRPQEPIPGASPVVARLQKQRQEGYEFLRERWEAASRPSQLVVNRVTYSVHYEAVGVPLFHHNHGFLFQDWQLDLFNAKQPTRVCIGGYGCGKTLGEVVGMLYRAATLPGFRGLALAPYAVQAAEVYKIALQILEGTLFDERFVIAKKTKPYPTLVIGNDFVGENTIECYSILDDQEKVLNLTADYALVDQAEKIDDIDGLIRVVRSRFRGIIQGRERLGYLTLVANSADNPMLWDKFDEGTADETKNSVFSIAPHTYWNEYITPAQLAEFEKSFARNEEDRRLYLMGGRPIGAGEHFSHETLTKCHSRTLDDMMEAGINARREGYVRKEQPRVQVYQWELPPLPDRTYLVIADPGYANPPERNSAAIFVWDITDFPKRPAHLWAFQWVFGDNSPDPWIDAYYQYVLRYRAVTHNAFDATGPQAGYDRWVYIFQEIMAQRMDLGGSKKFNFLNAAKVMAAKGLLQIPSIPAIFNQLAKYRLPDNKLRQDLVMAFIMTAGYLERAFYTELVENGEADNEEATDYVTVDRQSREGVGRNDRYRMS